MICSRKAALTRKGGRRFRLRELGQGVRGIVDDSGNAGTMSVLTGDMERRCGVSVINVRAFTDVGLVRKRNEDAILVAGWLSQTHEGSLVTMDFAPTAPFVCAVADGMGGHVGRRPREPGGVDRHRRAVAGLAYRRRRRATTLIDTNEQVRAVGVGRRPAGAGYDGRRPVRAPTTGIVVFNVGDSRSSRSPTVSWRRSRSTTRCSTPTAGRRTSSRSRSVSSRRCSRTSRCCRCEAGTYLMCSDGVSGVMTPEELRRPSRQPDLDDVRRRHHRDHPRERRPRQLLVPHRRDPAILAIATDVRSG